MRLKINTSLSAGLLFLLTMLPMTMARAEESWDILDGFTPLPMKLTKLGEHYVAVPYVNRERQLLAAVFFYAECGISSCELYRRAGFAITNAEGSDVRLHVNPDEQELIELIGAIASRQARNFPWRPADAEKGVL